MSAHPGSNRTRLKQSADPPPPQLRKVPSFSLTLKSKQGQPLFYVESNTTSNYHRGPGTPMPLSNDSSDLVERHQDDSAFHVTTMLANPRRGILGGPRALSDNGSSSLSEPEDVSDNESQGPGTDLVLRDQGNLDSEAETERLEISPKKAWKPSTVVPKPSAANTTNGQMRDGTGRAMECAAVNTQVSNWSVEGRELFPAHPGLSAVVGTLLSMGDFTDRKRKRTDLLSPATNAGDRVEPARKRSSSSRTNTRATDEHRTTFHTRSVASVGEEIRGVLMDVGRAEALDPYQEVGDNLETALSVSATIDRAKRKIFNNEVFEAGEHASKASDGSAMTGVDLLDGEAEADSEAEETVEAEAEEEELDTAAKSEDELNRKKNAMKALMPIENLFAIFRDRLFDERLASLSRELELLNQPVPIHPDYLAMRQCIDARRDEKVQLEHITLDYKVKCIENRVIAERAQLHGQFFQGVRELREQHLTTLNETFCQIQKERRQWKTKEPQFIYNFDPKRSHQITNQRAYNKEVSLLSGIALHVGFPAAPLMESAHPHEVEDDFRSMQLEIKPQASSFVTQLTNVNRANDVVAEEKFLQSTPWANPNHPVHQQAVGLGRPPAAQLPRDALRTPAPQRWLVDQPHGLGGSASTIGAASDPSFSMLQKDVERPASQNVTVVEDSSPFDQRQQSLTRYGSQPLVRTDRTSTFTPIPAISSHVPKPLAYKNQLRHQPLTKLVDRVSHSPHKLQGSHIFIHRSEASENARQESNSSLSFAEQNHAVLKDEDERHDSYLFSSLGLSKAGQDLSTRMPIENLSVKDFGRV